MDIDELTYNELTCEDAGTAKLLDLLLRRLFGRGAFTAVSNKDNPSITFRFWSTPTEFCQIVDAIQREVDSAWDQDYQELLDAYH